MPSVLFELLLAHFLGDFVFQSNDLIQRKYKSWLGTFEHVCIIAFLVILFLFPYWNHGETWMVAGVIFFTHFLQDQFKIKYELIFNLKKKSTFPFFADQVLHIGLIFYLSTFFNGLQTLSLPSWMHDMYFSQFLSLYCLGLISFSFVYDITAFQFARQKSKKRPSYVPNFDGMRKRILLFSLVYILLFVVNSSFM